MDIRLEVDVKTLPTIGPLFGSFKIQLDVFQTPIRLYNSLLHNNKLDIGLDMSQVKLPQYELTALPIDVTTIDDIDNSQINPSSILKYLGLSGIGFYEGVTSKTRQFNAVPLLTYWDIYKNYYSNKNEKIGAVVHCNAITPSPQTIFSFTIEDPQGANIDISEAPERKLKFKVSAYANRNKCNNRLRRIGARLNTNIPTVIKRYVSIVRRVIRRERRRHRNRIYSFRRRK